MADESTWSVRRAFSYIAFFPWYRDRYTRRTSLRHRWYLNSWHIKLVDQITPAGSRIFQNLLGVSSALTTLLFLIFVIAVATFLRMANSSEPCVGGIMDTGRCFRNPRWDFLKSDFAAAQGIWKLLPVIFRTCFWLVWNGWYRLLLQPSLGNSCSGRLFVV